MGITRENGYSARVEGFLITDGRRYRLAKTNGTMLVLADDCELPPTTEAELLIIVDGHGESKRIVLPDGVPMGQSSVRYEEAVPF